MTLFTKRNKIASGYGLVAFFKCSTWIAVESFSGRQVSLLLGVLELQTHIFLYHLDRSGGIRVQKDADLTVSFVAQRNTWLLSPPVDILKDQVQLKLLSFFELSEQLHQSNDLSVHIWVKLQFANHMSAHKSKIALLCPNETAPCDKGRTAVVFCDWLQQSWIQDEQKPHTKASFSDIKTGLTPKFIGALQ